MSTDDDDGHHPRKHTHSRNAGDVGYGRPPRAHQFKPGQSGNPKGRPKGRKSENQMLEELLSRKMMIREGERRRKISLREVIYHGIAEEAVKKKNLKAAAFLFDRSALVKLAQPESRELGEDDKAILLAYAEKFLSATDNEDESNG
jgi:hypothetical protein